MSQLHFEIHHNPAERRPYEAHVAGAPLSGSRGIRRFLTYAAAEHSAKLALARKSKRRAGRNATDGATNVVRVTVCLEDWMHPELARLGGSPWVREQIRNASKGGGSS